MAGQQLKWKSDFSCFKVGLKLQKNSFLIKNCRLCIYTIVVVMLYGWLSSSGSHGINIPDFQKFSPLSLSSRDLPSNQALEMNSWQPTKSKGSIKQAEASNCIYHWRSGIGVSLHCQITVWMHPIEMMTTELTWKIWEQLFLWARTEKGELGQHLQPTCKNLLEYLCLSSKLQLLLPENPTASLFSSAWNVSPVAYVPRCTRDTKTGIFY